MGAALVCVAGLARRCDQRGTGSRNPSRSRCAIRRPWKVRRQGCWSPSVRGRKKTLGIVPKRTIPREIIRTLLPAATKRHRHGEPEVWCTGCSAGPRCVGGRLRSDDDPRTPVAQAIRGLWRAGVGCGALQRAPAARCSRPGQRRDGCGGPGPCPGAVDVPMPAPAAACCRTCGIETSPRRPGGPRSMGRRPGEPPGQHVRPPRGRVRNPLQAPFSGI